MSYSIGQFSEIVHLSIDTLRYYEKEGLIFVSRDASGRRSYSEKDINWILFLMRLKETGMPIKEIRRYAELRYQGDATLKERMALLKQHRLSVLSEKEKWERNLQNLDEKIETYEQKITALQED